MPKTLTDVCNEVWKEIVIPNDMEVWPCNENDGILIGNSHLAIFLSRKTIDDSLHIERARIALPFLLAALKEHDDFRVKMRSGAN